ncbi:hypothetical protein IFM89_016273 [Coptis chinensis]|uniref:Uncharacterized protein n=1 Tax=Coptis chinensis TaxID=261450 RepID=A0A835H3C1_9MAGN|nr:hypothetical protein IFM89_016273 [Coptis chinensis]
MSSLVCSADCGLVSMKKLGLSYGQGPLELNDSMALHGSFGDEAHEVCFAVVVRIKGLFHYQLNIDADCSPRG